MGAKDDVPFGGYTEKIRVHRAESCLHALQAGEGSHILLLESQGADEPEIIELLFPQIIARSLQHGVGADAQPGEKADPQGDDGEDGEITAQSALDLAKDGERQYG